MPRLFPWPKIRTMKTSKLILPNLFILILLGISGCGTAGGYGSHNAVLASEMGVTYEYDSFFGGYEELVKSAKDHCKKFTKEPFLAEKSTRPTVSLLPFGLIFVDVQTFDCR